MATTDNRNRVAMENDGERVDGRAKVTGAAKYTHDINLPSMIYARHIRAPFANSKLVSSDVQAASKIKGVLDVSVDAAGRGEYAGQSVGHICAESTQLIDDALAALKLAWEPGEAKTNAQREAGPVPEPSAAEQQQLDAVLSKAAHVVEATYDTQVQHHVALETHGAVVQPLGDRAKVWGSTQGTSGFRDGLEGELGIDKRSIEVNCDYVGGGFGAKFGPGIEGKLAAQMAKKFNRPCKMMNTRKDESRDTGMRPGSIQYYKIGADEKGKIVGGRFYAWSTVGTRKGGGDIRTPTYEMGQFISGRPVEINLSSCPPRPQRAPGYPQGAFALESVFDELAAKAGVDPIEFRKINDPRPTRHKMYADAAKIIGWERRQADGKWPGVIKHGFGCGAAEWGNKFYAPAGAEIRIFPDAKVEIRCGIQDIGNGNRTMLVDLAAHSMGLDRKFIIGLCGSTEYPPAPASGGSVVARSVAPAVMDAGELAKAAIFEIAAKQLGVGADTLAIKGDAIVSSDGSKKLAWTDACKLITQDFLTVLGKGDPKYRGEGDSDGVCLAEVAVDTETGVVRVIKMVTAQQCGFPVNRKVVESQIVGGTIQALSYALFEERILNFENGAHVNPNMEWYKIAGTVDMPEIIPILDAPEGYTGVRSLGEPPIIGGPGAIANAVANAIGARVRSLPITPAKVLAAISEKGGVA